MAFIPLEYEAQEIINFFNQQPSRVKGVFNEATAHYKRILYFKIYSRYEIKLPQNMALNWFRFWLFHFGSIATLYTKRFGWVAFPYGVKSLDIYYQPKEITVSSPQFPTPKTGLVGLNSEIIRCFDDYYGFEHIVTKYAVMLAACDRSIDINVMSSVVSKIIACQNKKQADDFKTAYGLATEGNPFVTVLAENWDGLEIRSLIGDVKSDFIADKLEDLRRCLINDFLTEVGINNANLAKRERLNSDEVNANNEEVMALATVCLENIKAGMESVNELAGEELMTIKFRKYEGGEPDENDIMGNQSVLGR